MNQNSREAIEDEPKVEVKAPPSWVEEPKPKPLSNENTIKTVFADTDIKPKNKLKPKPKVAETNGN